MSRNRNAVKYSDYPKFTDEELILMLRNGQEDIMDYLLNKYKNLVKSQAGSYYLPGADMEDIIQEGMIGLFKAIRDYKEERQASFATFARLCISRNIKTALNKANRKSQDPLNNSLSLDWEPGGTDPDHEKDTGQSKDIRAIGVDGPEEALIRKEDSVLFNEALEKSLSKTESEVYHMMLRGLQYLEIARILEKNPKSVDNTITRIRGKAKKVAGDFGLK